MIIKHEPYRHFDYDKINQKNKNQQLKNIQHRLFKLNLSSDELKTLFQRTSLLAT